MATVKRPPAPAPKYGELKPRVIEFLSAVLVRGHKPSEAVRVWTKDGERRLGFVCARCKLHISVPVEGPMDLTGCYVPGHARGDML